jgi:hypothetical protein
MGSILQVNLTFPNGRLHRWPMWRGCFNGLQAWVVGGGEGPVRGPRRDVDRPLAAFAAVCGARLGSGRPQADFGQFACAGPGSGVLGENHYRALVGLDLINAALCERLDGLRAVVPGGGASATAGRPPHDHGLSSLVDTLSYGTLMRRLAAIAHQHRQHGLAIPAIDPAGKALLRAVRGAAVPRRRPRPASGLLARMATTCPGDLAGLRDRALLLLAAGTGLGRTVVSLDAQRVALVAGGWPPIRRHRARNAAQPRFVAVVRRDIRALIASFW